MRGAPQEPSVFRVGPEPDPDRYLLGAAVGSGAEGILYRGSIITGTGVELDVAIKMLQPRFLDQLDRWHERWTEQVELLRSLQVPGVVPVRDGFIGPLPHGVGQVGQGRTLYLVMNWVEGEPIDEWVRHRPERDPLDDLKILVQVGAALDLMHSGRATGGVPIVHRDVKPSNIIVTDRGAVLVDFGLTRGLADERRLTGITGTPGYLAPESVDDGLYSPASDRYAFGGVAYFVITGLEPPADHRLDIMRTTLAAAPVTAGRPDVVDHLMAMVDADPERRPAGLANWIGQVRQSSLQPGPEALSPPAPRRHSVDSGPSPGGDRRRRDSPRRRTMSIVGIAALVAAAALTIFAVRASTSGSGTNAIGSQTSRQGVPVSNRFTGAFDPTCGQGRFVPFPAYLPTVRIPSALGVGTTGAVLGYNFATSSAAGLPQTQLYPIGANCSANPQFVAATNNNPAPLPSITAIAVDDTSGDVYAAGYDQGGWIVIRYQPSGGLDPTFGIGGFVVHPTASSGSASAAGGWPTGIVETASRVYVVGVDGGSHASSRTVLVSLLKNGTADPQFNSAASKGVLITGAGPGSGGQTLAVTPVGSLLAGGSYADMGCGIFSIDEYQPTGRPVASFQPISVSGTGTDCGGSPVIPGFTAAQLVSIVPLSDESFDAVGYAFVADSSGSGLGNLTGFVARFRPNGSLDTSFGQRGVVLLPGLSQPTTIVGMSGPGPNMLGAVAQPNAGLVVAMVDQTGVGLVYLSPSGAIKGRVEVPFNPTTHPAIATGDAGRGRIEIVTFTDSEWNVGRYLGVQPTRNPGDQRPLG
jgi:serine/threonine protein kinase